MAIQFIDTRQEGLYPTPGMATAAGWSGVIENAANAYAGYKTAEKQKEDEAYQKAIEQMALGVVPNNASEIFKNRYGQGFNADDVIASIQAEQKQKRQKAAQDRISAYFKVMENVDVDGKPPASVVKDWQEAGFGEYPTMPGQPDVTGLPTAIPVPIKSAKKQKETQEIQKTIDETIKLSMERGFDWTYDAPTSKISPQQVPSIINAKLSAQYGPDWMDERPDIAQMVELSLQAYGLGAESPEPPQKPSSKGAVGQKVNKGGRSWVIVGFDDDGEPLVEPAP